MKLTILSAAVLPIIVGAAVLSSLAPGVSASAQDERPPFRRAQCGDFAFDEFVAVLAPSKGFALGHGDASREEALGNALTDIHLAAIDEGLAKLALFPLCPGPNGCPTDTWGCLRSVRFEEPVRDLKAEFNEFVAPPGIEFTICTLTAAGRVTCSTGCAPCL